MSTELNKTDPLKAEIMKEFEDRYGSEAKPIPEFFWRDLGKLYTDFPRDHWKGIVEEVFKIHQYNTLPKLGKFYEAAERLGLMDLRKKYTGPKKHRALQCRECGTYYSMKSRGCPKCGRMTEIVVVVTSQPLDYVRLQENCFECELYSPNSKGPSCKNYGSTGQFDKEPCLLCRCRECCEQARALNMGFKPRGNFMIPTKVKKVRDYTKNKKKETA